MTGSTESYSHKTSPTKPYPQEVTCYNSAYSCSVVTTTQVQTTTAAAETATITLTSTQTETTTPTTILSSTSTVTSISTITETAASVTTAVETQTVVTSSTVVYAACGMSHLLLLPYTSLTRASQQLTTWPTATLATESTTSKAQTASSLFRTSPPPTIAASSLSREAPILALGSTMLLRFPSSSPWQEAVILVSTTCALQASSLIRTPCSQPILRLASWATAVVD